MRNSRLLLVAAAGLLILSSTGQKTPEHEKIEDLGPGKTGEKVLVSGKVKDFRSFNESYFMNISDETGEVRVIDFNSGKIFSEGEKVSVNGRITVYHGELEVIARQASRKTTE